MQYKGIENLLKNVALIIDLDTIWVTINIFVENDEMNEKRNN